MAPRIEGVSAFSDRAVQSSGAPSLRGSRPGGACRSLRVTRATSDPAAGRSFLIAKDWAYWKEAILTDLERVPPLIPACVSRLDVMRIGHAMVRPTVGAVFSAQRQALKRSRDRLVFAHSDVSGLSLFEEAQFRGVTAADRVLRLIA